MLKAKFILIFASLCFIVFKASAIPDPKDAAHLIYTTVNAKLHQEDKNRQFAFLYLQQSDQDGVWFTSEAVRQTLTQKEGMLGKLTYAPPWPSLDLPSNMRIAGISANAQPGSNVGHAEQKMLADFKTMYDGVFPLDTCPAYIILATKLFPCYQVGNLGCGKDFIETTKSQFNACAKGEKRKQFLYLYIGQNAANDWNIQKKNFAENEIPIIYGPN
ncbi:Hypothetical predicted protein [Paramuricea clavata]|uniref:Uncharacterized protein n=1 Tax=Paramuricea clavata TaxID=317549 RepID=A0A7D9DIK9_PARCT|nr:Hypothetical predicted protein [Paramuricea clavata]